MRWPVTRRGFERGAARDGRRFMRNWQHHPVLYQQAERMLRSVSRPGTER